MPGPPGPVPRVLLYLGSRSLFVVLILLCVESVSRSTVSRSKSNGKPRVRARAPTTESAVDILYENQRGGFLCGMALFSSRALGNLDPTPWTNVVHKASPTDITNAQVPDPSWEWAWPEWRVNHDEATDADEDGWEYSFMFARAFSWHGPRWWNSFVRRRAWIRRRVKKRNGSGNGNGSGNYAAQDPFGFRGEYFTVEHDPTLSPTLSPTADGDGDGRSPSRVTSQAESSKAGTTAGQTAGVEDVGGPILEDVDSLLRVLRSCRIDREKIEAVENYLEHASGDMEGLQEEIHHIIALFVFQASRRLLLSRLTEVLDETQAKLKSKESGPESATSLERRADNLSAAIKHADEEVRRLEYWSDVKEMVESGESMGAVDGDKGWDEAGLEGLDQSGPARPNSPK